jgi:hypothetical protein
LWSPIIDVSRSPIGEPGCLRSCGGSWRRSSTAETRGGFAWLVCDRCRVHRLVPFSCKGRGFCPSCIRRRMTERALRWVDEMAKDAAAGTEVTEEALSAALEVLARYGAADGLPGSGLGLLERMVKAKPR